MNQGIPTGDKIKHRLSLRTAWCQPRSSQGSRAVQQQDVRKNYISILNDAPESERAAGTAQSQPGTMKDFVGRLTAMLKRRLPSAAITS
ncbi:hypothetical protein [Bradyrhizobium genosp. SA-3]|uniref:hypothetical protein n=1 Tax=Bradyrhizobium genosp. SA-3 TaxID=508868 RepID=UPI0010293B24|nr:hypothetical protein [Bradyrhizobium genosp. SA-3]